MTDWDAIVQNCASKENSSVNVGTHRRRLVILAVDQELKSSRERIQELEAVVRSMGTWQDENDICWCAEGYESPPHDEWCQKARKALGIETRTP